MDNRHVVNRVIRSGGVLATGIVYGTDAFFSIVGAKALSKTTTAGLTDVMGRLHEVADKRMPIVGASGLVLSLGCAATAGSRWGRVLGGTAAASTLTYVFLYSRYSKPINDRLVAAARSGGDMAEAHDLQRRWDRIVFLRYALMTVAMLCLGLEDL